MAQAQAVKVCDIADDVKAKLKKFRFRKEKNNAAICLKIDKDSLMVILDEEYEDISLEELQDELPSHQPRYLVYSYCYNHDDGRVSYPLIFVYISPQGAKPELQMMYAGSKLALVQETGLTKVYEIRNVDELTEDWLKEKLLKLR